MGSAIRCVRPAAPCLLVRSGHLPDPALCLREWASGQRQEVLAPLRVERGSLRRLRGACEAGQRRAGRGLVHGRRRGGAVEAGGMGPASELTRVRAVHHGLLVLQVLLILHPLLRSGARGGTAWRQPACGAASARAAGRPTMRALLMNIALSDARGAVRQTTRRTRGPSGKYVHRAAHLVFPHEVVDIQLVHSEPRSRLSSRDAGAASPPASASRAVALKLSLGGRANEAMSRHAGVTDVSLTCLQRGTRKRHEKRWSSLASKEPTGAAPGMTASVRAHTVHTSNLRLLPSPRPPHPSSLRRLFAELGQVYGLSAISV